VKTTGGERLSLSRRYVPNESNIQKEINADPRPRHRTIWGT
jgi:hypothetical protein